MNDELTKQVRRTLAQEDMIPDGARVLCGLSGGADSVALMLCLRELGVDVCACHLNHGLRDTEAEEDERFCARLCAALAIPFWSERMDVRALAQNESIETAARRIRYDFFERCADRLHAQRIATAHNADDNLETMLFRLIRGTGARGLAGIPPVRGRIVRPLIAVERMQIEAYLAQKGQTYRTDSTNLLDDCTRNRIRHTVMPALREIEPAAARHALETAKQLRQDNACLERIAQPCGDWKRKALLAQPAAVRSRALRLMLEQSGVPMGQCSARHIAALDRLTHTAQGQVSLPGGFYAAVQADALQVRRKAPHGAPELPLAWEQPVQWRTWRILLTKQRLEVNKTFNTFFVDYDTIFSEVLTVRAWRPHDRMVLPGARGARTLKRLYADRGIAPDVRDTLPVVAGTNGIVAAAGLGLAQGYGASDGKPGVWLQLEPMQPEQNRKVEE